MPALPAYGRVLLFFIEFNILIFIMICRQKRTHLNPGPAPQPAPGEEESHNTPGSCPGSFKNKKKRCYNSLLADLIHTDIPGYQNFVRMAPAFFDFIRKCIHHHIKKSATNFRKPLEVGLKLAIILRHLATGETYTLRITGWLTEPPAVNMSPRSAEPSSLNSNTNICAALLSLKNGG